MGFYEKLKADGNISDAYLVIKNMLNRDIGNVELFIKFSELSFEIAMYQITFEERKQMISDLNTALLMFSENTDIDEYVLNLIKDTQKRIKEAYAVICDEEHGFLEKKRQTVVNQNTELLNELEKIYNAMKSAVSQDEFEAELKKIAEIEEKFDKTVFTKNQQTSYDIMSKCYTEMIGKKMEELNRQSLLDYNKSAVQGIQSVLKQFKKSESNYKNSEERLKSLLISKLFIFDTSKLFNETLIFYNHVYSLIFQTVNNELKYKMTEWALTTSKISS